MTFLQAILKPVKLSHMIKMSTAHHPLLSINWAFSQDKTDSAKMFLNIEFPQVLDLDMNTSIVYFEVFYKHFIVMFTLILFSVVRNKYLHAFPYHFFFFVFSMVETIFK